MQVILIRCKVTNSKEEEILDVPDLSTVETVVHIANITPKQVIMINGRHAKRDFILREGDRIVVLPSIMGG